MTYQYFQKYPLAAFTLDEYQSMQVLPDLTVRSKFLANIVTNASNYDEYDIVSGETPEITADKFYVDSGLHWIILQTNGSGEVVISDDQFLTFGTSKDSKIEYDENGTDKVRVTGADWVFDNAIQVVGGASFDSVGISSNIIKTLS